MRPLRRPSELLLVVLGGVGTRLVQAVGGILREVLQLQARPGPALVKPQYAFNEVRGQYHSSAILRRLSALKPAGRAPVLGLADVDLFLPDAPYVLGDADRDAGTALVSVARLDTRDRDRLERRVKVEAVHEAGHLLGLGHCLDPRCALFLARDTAEVDRKDSALCPGCRAALGLP